MSIKIPPSRLRRIYAVLGIVMIGALLYQNFTLYSIAKNLRRSQMKIPQAELDELYSTDEVSSAVAALVNENISCKAGLKRQGQNLRECMSKLPQQEVDDFYKRHREELEQGKKAP